MKKLPRCARGHDIAVVGRYKGKRDGYGPCKECNKINYRVSRARRIKLIQEAKLRVGCGQCGYRKSARALDFHHLDPRAKMFTIAQRPFAPMKLLLAEMAKCEVICRNCHAEEHDL